MDTTEKVKDVIVVARNGYQCLVNIGPQNFTVDCYTPVNLSDHFSSDQLNGSPSLRAHLAQGNLILYGGQDLPKNLYDVSIEPMRQVEETKIETTYKQVPQTSAVNFNMETTDNIDDNLRDDIQKKVTENRNSILNTDKKILKKVPVDNHIVSTSDVGAPLAQRGEMTTGELQRTVTMDIDPKDFRSRQRNARVQLEKQEQADDLRVRNEIAEMENLEQDLTQ